jgi:hypothetical protein
MVFNPPADTPISAGDYLIVMGEPDKLHTLEGMLADAIADCSGARTPAKGSRRFPIQSVDFLGARVAQQKGRIVGRQTQPDTESACLAEVFQIGQNAQILPTDAKTKYLPSAVHLPQHSSAGVCQPGNRGCSPVPFTETSQSDL